MLQAALVGFLQKRDRITPLAGQLPLGVRATGHARAKGLTG
jgi:hypothetical protein